MSDKENSTEVPESNFKVGDRIFAIFWEHDSPSYAEGVITKRYMSREVTETVDSVGGTTKVRYDVLADATVESYQKKQEAVPSWDRVSVEEKYVFSSLDELKVALHKIADSLPSYKDEEDGED